jgi:hypothetical protein
MTTPLDPAAARAAATYWHRALVDIAILREAKHVAVAAPEIAVTRFAHAADTPRVTTCPHPLPDVVAVMTRLHHS